MTRQKLGKEKDTTTVRKLCGGKSAETSHRILFNTANAIDSKSAQYINNAHIIVYLYNIDSYERSFLGKGIKGIMNFYPQDQFLCRTIRSNSFENTLAFVLPIKLCVLYSLKDLIISHNFHFYNVRYQSSYKGW